MSNTIVRTNVMALNSHRNLGLVGNQQARSSARLASGFRINSAADDAAGLGISEKMRSQIRGLDQASRNANDGISLIQTAEGAMATVNEMVTRIRELVVQASNDTNAHDGSNLAQSDRLQIQREINTLLSEIDDTTARTEFNTRSLLDGTLGGAVRLAHADGTVNGVTIAGGEIDQAATVADANAVRELIRVVNVAGGSDVRRLMDILDENNIDFDDDLSTMLEDIGEAIADAAAAQDSALLADLTWAVGALSNLYETFNDITDFAILDHADVDSFDSISSGEFEAFLDAVDELMDATVAHAGDGLWFHIGANADQGINLRIEAVDVTSLDEAARESGNVVDGFSFADLRNDELTAGDGIMREAGEDVNQFLAALDGALAHVTGQRSHLGAVQNRLEFTIENLDIASENLSAAESRIRDADMALEMMKLTQANVLQQAATSMLAQANQSPQNVLQLLG